MTKISNRHNEETVQLGLRVMALCGGDAGRAHKLLASEIEDPPAKRTLQSWKDKVYAHRYDEILHEARQEINRAVANQAMEIAGKATGLEEQLIAETAKKIDGIPEKDLARSALAMTQIKAENVRTSRLLREQPTAISEVRPPQEIIAELKALNIARTTGAIDVEVVDETDEPH